MAKQYNVVISGDDIDLVRPYGFDDNDFWFYIALHDTDTLVGEIIYEDEYRDVESYGNIGYSIDKKYRGNGYAKKALKLMKQVLEGKKDKMIINMFEGNVASYKTAVNFGAKLVRRGTLPEKFVLDKSEGYSNNYYVFEYDLKLSK